MVVQFFSSVIWCQSQKSLHIFFRYICYFDSLDIIEKLGVYIMYKAMVICGGGGGGVIKMKVYGRK